MLGFVAGVLWERGNQASINSKLKVISRAGYNHVGLMWPTGLGFDICDIEHASLRDVK